MNELALAQATDPTASQVKVEVDGKPLDVEFKADSGRYVLSFDDGLVLQESQNMKVEFD